MKLDIKNWLNNRGISDEVIQANNITYQNGKIVIPIYSPTGDFLFNKYRRDPAETEGPKYSYDKGATATLYRPHSNIDVPHTVYIVEGELDALALQSRGFTAVSSTGGAGTFKAEWAEFLKDNSIFICYDNDHAGKMGTLKLLSIFPYARIIEIPPTDRMKDISDYLMKNSTRSFQNLCDDALRFIVPKTIEQCRDLAQYWLDERQIRLQDSKPTEMIDLLLLEISRIYETFKKKKKPPAAAKDGDAIERARAVPIPNYIKFNFEHKALCINHTEKSPSMHWFKKNNKVKCFGCGYNGDTIDVVQKLFNLTKAEAIKKINE